MCPRNLKLNLTYLIAFVCQNSSSYSMSMAIHSYIAGRYTGIELPLLHCYLLISCYLTLRVNHTYLSSFELLTSLKSSERDIVILLRETKPFKSQSRIHYQNKAIMLCSRPLLKRVGQKAAMIWIVCNIWSLTQ